jgi:hypothetical protein
MAMSERTAASLQKLDELIPVLRGLPASADQARLVEETEALRRAVAAFHMEAIRFRMHAVERFLKATGDAPQARALFDQTRAALETAGFYTRSHSAPS